MLKKRKLTFKKASKHWKEKNKEELIEDRFHRCIDYVTIKSKGYKFIYIDESFANESIYPSYGYSKAKTPYIITTGN